MTVQDRINEEMGEINRDCIAKAIQIKSIEKEIACLNARKEGITFVLDMQELAAAGKLK